MLPPSLGRLLEGFAGCVLAGATLHDVFDTVVVPGSLQGWLRSAYRIRALSLPVWRWNARRKEGPARLPRGLAPFILLCTFAVWMSLLLLAFGLMNDALRGDFRPPLRDFWDALHTAGLTLATTGLSGRDVDGAARWVELLSGFAGLAVLTMALTYVLQVQNGLQQRDAALSKLATVAGRPATGLAVLETFAELNCRHELDDFFQEWRDWTASVLHSHTSHPVLAYFRSMGSEVDWPSAMAVVLDAASFHAALVDDKDSGAAMLLHREGSRLAASLARLFELEESARAEPLDDGQVRGVLERLARAGYAVRGEGAAGDRLRSLRGDYAGRLNALADHFGVPGVAVLDRHDHYVSEYRR